MTKVQDTRDKGGPRFDLEERTERFAREVRAWVRRLPTTLANREDAKQLIRSSGSVAANYFEANDALGPKDFRFRIKISRKEAKESGLWLRLIDVRGDDALLGERRRLDDEAAQLVRIFSAILRSHGPG
jgi:four helix bundle protein